VGVHIAKYIWREIENIQKNVYKIGYWTNTGLRHCVAYGTKEPINK
jgi:hypothetical protein